MLRPDTLKWKQKCHILFYRIPKGKKRSTSRSTLPVLLSLFHISRTAPQKLVLAGKNFLLGRESSSFGLYNWCHSHRCFFLGYRGDKSRDKAPANKSSWHRVPADSIWTFCYSPYCPDRNCCRVWAACERLNAGLICSFLRQLKLLSNCPNRCCMGSSFAQRLLRKLLKEKRAHFKIFFF